MYFVSFDSFDIGYFVNLVTYHAAEVLTPWHTLDLKTCFSRKPVFGGKISLIFPIIYRYLTRTYPFDLSDAWMPNYPVLNGLAKKAVSSLTDFIEKTCLYFELLSTFLKLHWNYLISWSVMPKPVFFDGLGGSKEYNSLLIFPSRALDLESVGQLAPQHLMQISKWHI